LAFKPKIKKQSPMHPILKNILAILVGAVIGSILNMGIITLSGSIIPPPEGSDNTTMEGLIASMHLYEPKHFIFPFLAHAIGTFVGAFLTAMMAANHQLKLAFVIGFFFLAAGIYMVASLPSPLWFSVLDLAGAYLPMAYFGGRLALATKYIIKQRD
jgi:uncharacterized membrane protein YqgA involved in biofilm formation